MKEKMLIKKVNIEIPKIQPAGIKISNLSIRLVFRMRITPIINSGAKYRRSSNQKDRV